MISELALINPAAHLGVGVSVGPFSIIEAGVEVGDETEIGSHVIVRSNTTIGKRNRFFQYCSVGEEPQYAGYAGEDTRLIIGDNNVFREFCTINRGTPEHLGETRIGDDNFLMAYVHVAHDCDIENNTIFANCASLAGHVSVGQYAILGGFTLIHQFCRVGAHSITGIGSVCLQDVPPFVVAAGNTARPHGINTKGLRRRGFTDQTIAELRRAYRTLYRSQLDLKSSIVRIEQDHGDEEAVGQLLEFLRSSDRGIIR